MPGPELGVKLYADIAELASDLGKGAHIAEREMENIRRSAIAAGTAIGTMAVSAPVALTVLVKKTIDGAEQINKLSQRTGIAVEHLSEMKFAAELSDVSMGELSSSVAMFNSKLVEAQDQSSKTGMLFRALGVDIKAGPHQALLQFADALRGLSTEAQVNVLRQFFGRAGDKMLPFILGLRDSTEEAKRLGLTMSAEMARDAEKFNDNMKRVESAASQAGIVIANHLLPHLVTMSEQFVEARKNGDLWVAMLKQAGVTLGQIAVSPLWFALDPKSPSAPARQGSQADVRRIDNALEPPRPNPNQDQIVCIASGGRWENGRCIRKGDEAAGRRELSEMEKIARARVELEEMAATDTREAWEAYTHITVENERRSLADRERMYQEWFRTIDMEQERAIEEGAELLAALEAQTRRNMAAGRELGFTFASAFEDAVLEGEKLRDVLNALAKDIARIILRRTVTEPMANAIANAIGGSFNFAGGRAEGGTVPANSWALVGERGPELAYFGPGGGQVIPNEEIIGSRVTRNRTVNTRNVAQVTINVGSLDPRSAAAVIAANSEVIRNVIRGAFNRQGRSSPI